MTLRQWVTRSLMRNPRAYLSLFCNLTIAIALLFAYATIFFHPDSLFHDAFVVPPAMQGMFLVIFGLVVAAVSFTLLYAIGVLYKERETQFGLLLLMGITRRQLQGLIGGETAVVGFLAIALGVGLGAALSTGLLYLLHEVTGLSLAGYFSFPALGYAAGSFALLLLLVALSAPGWVQRRRIILLLQGERRPRGTPVTSVLYAIFAFLCLAGLIGSCLWGSVEHTYYQLFSCLAFMILGCYFFYSQGSVALANRVRNQRAVAWCKGRILWLSDLAYRLRDNARLLYFLTLAFVLSWGVIGVLSVSQETDRLVQGPPQLSYQVVYRGPVGQPPGPSKSSHQALLEQKLRTQFGVTAFQRVDSLELSQQPVRPGEGIDDFKVFHLLPASQYAKVQEGVKGPKLPLGPDDLAVLRQMRSDNTERAGVQRNDTATEFETLLARLGLQADKESSYTLPSTKFFSSDPVWVVGDRLFLTLQARVKETRLEGLELRAASGYLFAENQDMKAAPKLKQALQLMKEFKNHASLQEEMLYLRFVNDKLNLWSQVLGALSALLLATIFLVLGNSFLLARLYTDVRRQRKHFHNLRRLGVTRAELRHALTVQMATLFFLPLGVVLLLTECFFYYASRVGADFLAMLERPVDTTYVFVTAGTTTLLLLALEVGIFCWVRRKLLRSLIPA